MMSVFISDMNLQSNLEKVGFSGHDLTEFQVFFVQVFHTHPVSAKYFPDFPDVGRETGSKPVDSERFLNYNDSV